MSGILKTYFATKKNKNINISACKCLTTYNQDIRLHNSGLLLTENNILKINKKFPNSTNKTKTNDTDYYIKTESNPFNINFFYPKNNSSNTFYEEVFFSHIFKNRQNKNLKPNNGFVRDLTINKINKVPFPILAQKKRINKTTITNNKKSKGQKNNVKCFTIKNNCKENSNEVEKIVYNLINNNNNNKNYNTKKLHHANSSENFSLIKLKNQKYPKEKSISPFYYIDYNLKKNPEKKEFFKSFNTQLKCLNNKAEYRKTILSQVDTNYRHRLKVENLKNDYNNNIDSDNSKKKIEEFFVKIKNDNKNNFHFNLYDYYNNIHKTKKNNKNISNRNFGKLEKIFNNKQNIISFDRKLQNFEASTIKAIKHLDSLSHNNRKMLKNILNIFNVYEK